MKMTPPAGAVAALALACLLGDAKVSAIALGPARLQRVSNRSSQAPAKTALPVNLAIIADKCKCKFVGLCTCQAAVDFMDCVADACASGQCECKSVDFMKSCESMKTTCPSAGLGCSEEKATCLHQELPGNQSIAELTQELEMLRKRKCILQHAVDGGYTNAGKRLTEVKVQIQGHLDVLKLKGGAPVYMGCTPLSAGAKISWLGGEVEEGINTSLTLAPATTAAPATAAPLRAATEPASASPAASSYLIPFLVNYGVYLVLVVLFAFFYDRVRLETKFPQVQGTNMPDVGFSYGLFTCFQDLKLSALSFFCLPIRWADTMDKSKQVAYWPGIAIILTLLAFVDLSAGLSQMFGTWAKVLSIVALPAFVFCMVLYRQKLRREYGIVAGKPLTYVEDCLSWWLCPCCAAVQEARQVEFCDER